MRWPDLDDVPALMVGVSTTPGRSEELTVRPQLPRMRMFSTTFSGLPASSPKTK